MREDAAGRDALGAVLAGGLSRRFGSDKAAAVVAGIPLVERAAATLEVACEEVVVVSSRPVVTERDVVPDARPPCGPLGGIEAALSEARARGRAVAVVLGCDLPLVTPETVARLVRALASARAACAVVGPVTPAGARSGTRNTPLPEPVCAAYDVSCLADASRLLDAGERHAGALLGAVGGVTVAVRAEELLNVNTPGAARRAEALLRERAAAEA